MIGNSGLTEASDLTGASDLISGMSLNLALTRRAVCLMSQIKMPSVLSSDFCLLGPIWVWVPDLPVWCDSHKAVARPGHFHTNGTSGGRHTRPSPFGVMK